VIGADSGRIVGAVTIIDIYCIDELTVVLLFKGCWDDISISILLAMYMPPDIIVNAKHELLFCFYHAM
jgi:hypothetical protein